jgi:hypothetical protein
MTLNYKDHEAVEARNARMSRSAEESGKQATTAPGASGRRGDLIAVVTVRHLIILRAAKSTMSRSYSAMRPCINSLSGSQKHVTTKNGKTNNSTPQTR